MTFNVDSLTLLLGVFTAAFAVISGSLAFYIRSVVFDKITNSLAALDDKYLNKNEILISYYSKDNTHALFYSRDRLDDKFDATNDRLDLLVKNSNKTAETLANVSTYIEALKMSKDVKKGV